VDYDCIGQVFLPCVGFPFAPSKEKLAGRARLEALPVPRGFALSAGQGDDALYETEADVQELR